MQKTTTILLKTRNRKIWQYYKTHLSLLIQYYLTHNNYEVNIYAL